MIRVNDTQDPMFGSVVIDGAELLDDGELSREFTAPQGEFTARLMKSVHAGRFLVSVGDLDAPEGTVPDIWYGVVERWQPAGSRVRVTARAARTVEERIHP